MGSRPRAFGAPRRRAQELINAPSVQKPVRPNVLQRQEEPNYIVLRYADLLLVKAEAANEAAGAPTAEAYQAVNAVRARAGLPNPAGLSYRALEDSVFVERRKELVGEGPDAHLDSQRNWAWAVARIQRNMALGAATNFATSARSPAGVPAVVPRDARGFRARHSPAAPDTTVARAARLDLSPTATP